MRTLIVEDQRMFRDLLAKVCESHFHFEHVEAVGTGAGAEAAMAATAFELLVLDIDLPDRDGFSLAELAMGSSQPPRVLGMSAYCDEYMVFRVINSSMHGFIDKTGQSVDTLQHAIEAVCAGRYFFSDVVNQMRLALRNDPRAFPKLLTDRERQLLGYFGAGLSCEEVGARLGILESTVQWHRKQMMRKLDLHTAVDLMRYAAEKGFTRLGGANRSIQPRA